MQRLSAILSLIATLALVGAFAEPAFAQTRPPFDVWLSGVRAEALSRGVSQRTVDAALSGLTPNARVIELDRRQPEGRLTFAQYRNNVINSTRINTGRQRYAQHRTALAAAEQRSGVPAHVIVALWGIETSYGGYTGDFSVIRSLATLAYDGRRSDFFRTELLTALDIIDDGHVTAQSMIGSWAGAMGQTQFMPSSFVAYAVDGNGDGRRDIWGTLPDVFASTANYLSQHGWEEGVRWGRPVLLPTGFSPALIDLEVTRTVDQWSALGVRQIGGAALPQANDILGSIVQPDGPGTDAFLVYENFRVFMRWNRSTYFALAVGLLSDQIAGR